MKLLWPYFKTTEGYCVGISIVSKRLSKDVSSSAQYIFLSEHGCPREGKWGLYQLESTAEVLTADKNRLTRN